jgi:hypothetical protein
MAQYRNGLMIEALATLARSNDLNHQKEHTDLALLVLARPHLGRSDPARETLARLRAVMEDPQQARESGVAGVRERGRDDRARPGLPGRAVRTVIDRPAADSLDRLSRRGDHAPLGSA